LDVDANRATEEFSRRRSRTRRFSSSTRIRTTTLQPSRSRTTLDRTPTSSSSLTSGFRGVSRLRNRLCWFDMGESKRRVLSFFFSLSGKLTFSPFMPRVRSQSQERLHSRRRRVPCQVHRSGHRRAGEGNDQGRESVHEEEGRKDVPVSLLRRTFTPFYLLSSLSLGP